ncbi:MAG: cytochrome P450 [Gemmataceae bacterium]
MSVTISHPRVRRRWPPELPGGLPLLGHALTFQRNPVRFLQRGRELLGDIYSFPLLGNQMVVLTGPKANETFFRASDAQLSAKAAYQFTVPIFGPGIAYDTTPERMAEQMSFFTPALTERRFRRYVEYIQEEIDTYLERWPDQGEVDVLTVTNELTVFIASRCLIGREFRQKLSAEFAQLYHDLEGSLNLLGFFWPRLPLPAFQRRDRARARMVAVISQIIADRRARNAQEEDFLQTLMTARYSDGTALSDDTITGMLLTLVFAGQHTSAVQAAWAGIELLRHPGYLQRVLDEQEAIMGDRQTLDFDILQSMKVLERGIQESERLHPPLIMLMRKVIGDLSYRDIQIPIGSMVMVSPAVSHRIPEVFREPNRYDPDRFGPDRAEDKKAKFAIITFGGGKHGCIGLTFAYLQVKAIWSTLLRRFDLELLHPQVEPNYTTFVVGPKPPCRMRFRRRNH